MKKILSVLVLLCLTAVLLTARGLPDVFQAEDELTDGLYAEISSNRGVMIFRLDYEGVPLTVTNFCGRAEGSLGQTSSFNGLVFDRHVSNYAVFAGKPSSTFPREKGGNINTGLAGVLLMDGFLEETSATRFFIIQSGDDFLKTKYTPLGMVVSGAKVVKKLQKGDRIESVRILRKGKAAQNLKFDEAAFNQLRNEVNDSIMRELAQEEPLLAQAIELLGADYKKTPTGIYYSVLSPGEGEPPKAGMQVSMHYTGTLLDGTVFDSSRPRGQTFDFILGKDGVIPGWIEMVTEMRPGEIRQVIIPPHLAYGEQGYGPIAPNSWLIFEMELTAVSGD